MVECQLLAQKQVLRRQLRARRHRKADQRDDIDQEVADRGRAMSGGLVTLLCQTKRLPAPNLWTDVVFAEHRCESRPPAGQKSKFEIYQLGPSFAKALPDGARQAHSRERTQTVPDPTSGPQSHQNTEM